ncbi:GNAT family N-acetyltransferase [Streptosporangium sp. NPDC051022]|uniref:GNAT family N-acetyltransferase n=1 Tax=Streptosporangium sp. NPDC051022 TaxID=3155752 RepID=UPI00344A6D84
MRTYEDLPAELVTERLQMRRWVPSDAEEYRGLWLERDTRVPPVRQIDAEGRPTVEDIRSWLLDNPLAADPGLGLLPIELRDTGEFIGYCGLTVGQGSFDEPEIAYELAQRAHGHGYATEAARAVIEAATRTGRRRLWATVWEWNAPSFRVLEKLGFHRSDRITEDAEHGNTIWMTRVLDPR